MRRKSEKPTCATCGVEINIGRSRPAKFCPQCRRDKKNAYTNEFMKNHYKDPIVRERVREYQRNYARRPHVRIRILENERNKYHKDENYRKRRLEINRKSSKKREKKNGKKILELCKTYGFSEEVAKAMVSDDTVLDEEMGKRGIVIKKL